MWYVFSSAFNKEATKRYEIAKRYELITKKFDTFNDARAYIQDKMDKYSKFCIDEIGCDSYIEDYGNDVFFNFLGMRIDFDILKADHHYTMLD